MSKKIGFLEKFGDAYMVIGSSILFIIFAMTPIFGLFITLKTNSLEFLYTMAWAFAAVGYILLLFSYLNTINNIKDKFDKKYDIK